jgi:undecaprenyl-diphosphatase
MTLWAIILLAVVQGVTEFLPVSSSGHLVVAGALLELFGQPPAPDLLEVEIVLHVGTLLAVLVFFWREVLRLVGRDWTVVPLLAVGTIPAVAIGLPLKHYAEHLLESPLLAGFMFPVTAALLVWGARQPEGTTSYRDLSYKGALGIGLLQSLALLPGVSRSGATIAGGLVAKLDRISAGTFAFLLAIPAIGGAGLLQVIDLVKQLQAMSSGSAPLPAAADASGATGTASVLATDPITLAIGALISALVGFGALWLLLRWVRKGRLAMFAWYLVPLGVAVVTWQLLAG